VMSCLCQHREDDLVQSNTKTRTCLQSCNKSKLKSNQKLQLIHVGMVNTKKIEKLYVSLTSKVTRPYSQYN
jgi:hypothetical protein